MIVVLDTETTGLGNQDEVLQLAMLRDNGEVLFNEYFKPTSVHEWPEAERINHISPQMVFDKPEFSEAAEKIRAIISRSYMVIGYNLPFDIRLMMQSGVTLPEGPIYYDVMAPFRGIYNRQRRRQPDAWVKLTMAAEFVGYAFHGMAHDALEDCRATLKVYNWLQKHSLLGLECQS